LLTHEQIIKGCIKNDRKVQKELFERFSPKMYGYCLRYSVNAADAQDVLQEGFIKVFEKISTLKNPDQLEGWMSRIFINLAISRFRKNKIAPNMLSTDDIDVADEAPIEEMNELTPSEVLLKMQELPELYRTVLNLYAIDGHSHREISQMLDITETNSKSILSRSRKMLRELISKKSQS
jgi:RNA polymerase sigma-70 factor (ECF subfamily)